MKTITNLSIAATLALVLTVGATPVLAGEPDGTGALAGPSPPHGVAENGEGNPSGLAKFAKGVKMVWGTPYGKASVYTLTTATGMVMGAEAVKDASLWKSVVLMMATGLSGKAMLKHQAASVKQIGVKTHGKAKQMPVLKHVVRFGDWAGRSIAKKTSPMISRVRTRFHK